MLAGYRGRGSYLLIEVKTFDAMCPAHASEVLRARHQPHTAVATRSRRDDYQLQDHPLPPRFELVVFSCSTAGSFGSEAHRLLRDFSRRVGTGLPPGLVAQGEATWAAPAFAPFVRMAVSTAVRRGLAQ